jgi:hypothetical protein
LTNCDQMRFVLALFGFSWLFCTLFNEKGNIPLPLLALLITIITTGMIQVSLAIISLIRAVFRNATVRSLLPWAVIALAVVAMSVGRSSLPTIGSETLQAISDYAQPDVTIESSTLDLYDPDSTSIVSSTMVLHEQDARRGVKLCDEPSLDYTIVDGYEFIIASNREARSVVEWIMDETAASARERLLVWYRHMAAITSKLKGGPNPVFIERWVDVTTYVQNLPTHPDPLDIYQKVWRTLTAYHMLKRDMVTRDATLQGLE